MWTGAERHRGTQGCTDGWEMTQGMVQCGCDTETDKGSEQGDTDGQICVRMSRRRNVKKANDHEGTQVRCDRHVTHVRVSHGRA